MTHSIHSNLINEFSGIAGVADVRVFQNGQMLDVEIELSSFDQPTQYLVYDREIEVAAKMPDYHLNFLLIDGSQKLENAQSV